VVIDLVPHGRSSTGLSVLSRSALSTTLVDWGKNRQNVQRLLDRLAGLLR
jgi:hypothetical protein